MLPWQGQVCVVNLLAAIFGDQRIKGFREKGDWNTGIKSHLERIYAENERVYTGNDQDSLRLQPFVVREAVKEDWLTISQPLNFTQREWVVAAEIKDILYRKPRRKKEMTISKGGE